ncbi:MAG: HAMP domain-containing sensor histidine kinase [Gemmataceae bacterium]
MLRLTVRNAREHQELQHDQGPLELGRGPRRGNVPRCMIQDAYVSKDHVRLEELPSGELRLENLSSKQPILLTGGSIPPGGSGHYRAPLRMGIGDTVVEIEPPLAEDDDSDALKTVMQPLRSASQVAGREPLLNLEAGPTPELLTQWFEAVVAVQRSSPASPEYYDQTARALVELVSLDSGLILLRAGDGWRVVARAFRDEGPGGREFSHTILARVVRDRRTFFQPRLAASSQGDSLQHVVSVVASPIFDNQDQVAGALYGARLRRPRSREIGPIEAQLVQVLASGVTAGLIRIEQEQRANELRIARDVAEAADRTKGQFLANMSHELRTPLNAIIGYSEMLREEAEDRQIDGFVADLQKITSAGKHLLALINDILDLSKIEAGKVSLNFVSFDGGQLVQEVVAMVQTLVKPGVRLVVPPTSHLGDMNADPTRLRQCLFNLLSNAAKFTDLGTITLTTERRPHQGVDWVVFTVADTGIGMNSEQVAKLFKDFEQVHAATRQAGGTGLGLSISRKLTRLMGGDITVKSEAGKGTTFTLYLPACPSVKDSNHGTCVVPPPGV